MVADLLQALSVRKEAAALVGVFSTTDHRAHRKPVMAKLGSHRNDTKKKMSEDRHWHVGKCSQTAVPKVLHLILKGHFSCFKY